MNCRAGFPALGNCTGGIPPSAFGRLRGNLPYNYKFERPVMKRITFFFILLGLFLDTSPLAYAQNNRHGNPKFTPPIVTCDYNDGVLTNSLGGISGGKETLPGTLYATAVPDEGFTRGSCGYSVRLDYNVEKLGEYSFYWMKLGHELSVLWLQPSV